MSTVLTRKGADYSLNARAFVPPVTNGLQGWWYLGGMTGDNAATALARTTKNLAPTSYVLTASGNPTISNSGYVLVDGTNGFTSNLPETLEFSVVLMALPVAVNGAYVTWFQTGSTAYWSNASTLTTTQTFCPRDNGSGGSVQANTGGLALGAGWTSMKVLSWKYLASSNTVTIRDLTGGGANANNTPTSNRILAGAAATMKLGIHSAAPGQVRLGFVAVYNRAISDAEGDTIRQFVAKYRLAKYGDVV